MAESGVQAVCEQESEEKGSIYVFPTPNRVPTTNFTGSMLPTITTSSLSWLVENVETNREQDEDLTKRCRRALSPRTHARSASHGGAVLATSSTGWQTNFGNTPANFTATTTTTTINRPSALKKPGHQRAFSQGQAVDVQRQSAITGHSRVGSRTDFILPPGHRTETRSQTGVNKTPSFRGHSRQASR